MTTIPTAELARRWGCEPSVVLWYVNQDRIPGATRDHRGHWQFPIDTVHPATVQAKARGFRLTPAGRAAVAAYRRAQGRETIDVYLRRAPDGRWELAT